MCENYLRNSQFLLPPKAHFDNGYVVLEPDIVRKFQQFFLQLIHIELILLVIKTCENSCQTINAEQFILVIANLEGAVAKYRFPSLSS